ncbi:unnamed protein product, partial [Symbiodinium pilosum]
AADVVVLNKTDLATKEQLDATRAVVKAINKKAAIIETTFGKVTLSEVLEAVSHQEETAHDQHEHAHEEHAHEEHGHAEHGHEGKAEHGDHGHEEAHSHEDCGHAHSHASNCSDPECTDASHGHSHSHSHEDDCSDPNCTDSSHEHGHSHSHSTTTAEERFGITSFTYTARRPLSETRFTQALQKWPIPKHTDLRLLLAGDDNTTNHPMNRVIRSKGFCWLETQPSTRVYWSHAGRDMQLNYSGLWWGAMSKDQVNIMKKMAASEYERALREDWDEEWGDRRQEIVFIGQRLDEAAIREMLDECLLTDAEMLSYKKKQDAAMKDMGLWASEPIYQDAGEIE